MGEGRLLSQTARGMAGVGWLSHTFFTPPVPLLSPRTAASRCGVLAAWAEFSSLLVLPGEVLPPSRAESRPRPAPRALSLPRSVREACTGVSTTGCAMGVKLSSNRSSGARVCANSSMSVASSRD